MADAENLAKFAASEAKMRADGLPEAAILAFKHSYMQWASGATGMIAEADITPASDVPALSDLRTTITQNPELLSQTVVLKLNGGLGTSMGLDFAKSLLQVKGKDTFLDLTAKQVIAMRKKFKANVRFILMNSFSTSDDTMEYLAKYPDIVSDPDLEFVQNKVPKIDAATMLPGSWAKNPKNEWCPPGHGDLYAALEGSGTLDKLLAAGVKYMFVSNSDNLGATLDLDLLTYFAEKDLSFMMECCERTVNDKKGGHLAVRTSDGNLILREAAQCADEDESAFQDISKHRFFNTNNLWVRLDKLKEEINKAGGFIPLPMIRNAKTIDPKDDTSTKVIQLETAMGAAIECFAGAGAVCVPKERFAPVKKCSDLLMLRSDCYTVTPDSRLVLSPGIEVAPELAIDAKKYKLVQALEAALTLGTPSLKACTKLKVDGYVYFSRRNVLQGTVTIVNSSKEPKVLPPGTYSNCTVDLSAAPSLGALLAVKVPTAPIADQKPGTSGLRKKTKEFMEGSYLQNFVQATFSTVKASGADMADKTLVIGGDGRYFNPTAIQTIVKMAVANGVNHIAIGQGGLLSTPAVSAEIRERGPSYMKAFGGFILTASHNPGGPDEDFGIKYNVENGGPAPEGVTGAIYDATTTIGEFHICPDFPDIDLDTCGTTKVESTCGSAVVTVEVIDAVESHVELLKSVFDFDTIKTQLLSRGDFSMVYDCMHGVQGPYARAVFVDELGLGESCLLNAVPKDDFNGHHADPNLTYAVDLVKAMGLDKTGLPVETEAEPPSFGAAADGDADRNMICGSKFFVTPSDSLAILAEKANCVPFFRDYGGLKAVARSMPTSGAVDRVAAKHNLALFETPTGWKYFGNLMDSKDLFGGADFTPLICGEESFGTGSNHIREKDGLWAVLFWLQILAAANPDASQPLVSVQALVEKHWEEYGRNYYTRYDYEGVDKTKAEGMFEAMRATTAQAVGKSFGAFTVATADDFTYLDPVDGSVSKKQGLRFLMACGSRVIFRLSGTAGSGATVRMYLEKYEPDAAKTKQVTAEVMGELVAFALQLSDIKAHTGVDGPTVIT
eukprot:CAMPEP_0171761938 /NCGR_PEP_ID=MMETSP0991-20121206/48366_1 /TAXON_ID=483369 /ORGANISM="non described non described, Strain CCMP2098" /LENGTH=1066 /DNA_ID=CAMNT_0012365321 /DNA_START=37 /DNA_END=3233 /DNA_ORIENTATION=+